VSGPLVDARTLLDALALPSEALDAPDEHASGAKVSVHAGVLQMTLPVRVPDDGRHVTLRVVCGSAMLVTIEPERLAVIDRLVDDLGGNERPVEAGLPGILLDIVETVTRTAGPEYLSLRRRLNELDASLEDRPLDVPVEALLAVKRRISQLEWLLEEQGYCLVELQRWRALRSQSEDGREQLRAIVADMERGLRLLGQLEGRVRDLRQHHLQCTQEATGRRLNMLAILSAIYLPATLIAGVYGMNFEHIPITQIPHGYLLVIAIMAALVFGQLWFFHRRGWFD